MSNYKKPVDLSRANILGVGISVIGIEEAADLLLAARRSGRTGYVCVTGVHGVIESQGDPELQAIHNRSFLTVADGMPTVWMGREQGFSELDRVYGPDLMLKVFEKTAKSETRPLTHFLYGATEEVLSKLKRNLEERFPGVRIVGTYAPPFRSLEESEEEALREIVADCRPDFFWVGLSTPKQERFMYAHRADIHAEEGGPAAEDRHSPPKFPLDAGILLGVGAAFAIHAGLQKDAPEWIKHSGLQWFHRLCREPRQLWKRYLHIVPTFLWLAGMQVLGVKEYRIEDGGC